MSISDIFWQVTIATPAMEGVIGAGTKEGLMGFLGGAAVSPLTGAPTTPTTQQVPGQPTDVEVAAQAARVNA